MNARETMVERRLAGLLAEVQGGGPAEDLAARIAQRLRAEAAPRHPLRFVVALLMAAGLAVVVGIAWLCQDDARRLAQDPNPVVQADPVRIDTAMVRATITPVVEPPVGNAVDRLLAVAGKAKVCVVVAPGVVGDSKCSLEGLDWREAIEHIAAEVGVGVAAYGDAFVVGVGSSTEPKRRVVSMKFAATGLHQVLKKLAIAQELELVVATDANGRVAGVDRRIELDVEAVPVRSLLEVVAANVGLEVVTVGSVFVLRKLGPVTAPARVALNFRNHPVADVWDRWAHIAGRNVVIDPAVQGILSVRAFQFVERDWLNAMSAATAAEVDALDRGILRVMPRVPLPASVTLTAEGAEPVEVAQTLRISTEQCVVAPGGGCVNVFAWRANAHDLLHSGALASGRTMVRRGAVYVIE